MKDQNIINLFWFRRDLRLHDNHGLFKALEKGNVLPIFIFDPEIIDKLEDKNDLRINFIYHQLTELNKTLKDYSTQLNILYNKPIDVFKDLLKKYRVETLFFNHDYEPYATKRDQEVTQFLNTQNISVYSFKDHVIFERSEILKNDLKPYTIFTPYSKKWKENIETNHTKNFDSENLLDRFYKNTDPDTLNLKIIGFNSIKYKYPSNLIDHKLIKDYDKTRDYPFLNGTSRLSIHLRFGTISIRNLVKTALRLNETFLNELIWREFYMMILWHFPHVVENSFKKEYDQINWNNNENDFQAWCNGQTGYPIVDAGMRELNKTGFMHNRVRMITASFLTKHLLIDWRWGEAYFAQKLLDYELASNNGGWQWAASTGCDAVPYFRIFNPEAQTKKFDENYEYIRKWIPELESNQYPKPIVDHKFARERALTAYKKIKR